MSLPYFKFYPTSWMGEGGLRMCSPTTRAIWIDLICLAHQGVPYGHLATTAGPLTVGDMAAWCRVSTKEIVRAVEELERRGVISRSENGAVFSRRMVRDEEIRRARAAGGIKSLQNPRVPRKDTIKDTPKDILQGYPLRISSTDASKDTLTVVSSFLPSEVESSNTEEPSTRADEFVAILRERHPNPRGMKSITVETAVADVFAQGEAERLDAGHVAWCDYWRENPKEVRFAPKLDEFVFDGWWRKSPPKPEAPPKMAWEIGLEDDNAA